MQGSTISLDDYRDRVYGCFMGKNIGGTLGGPYEGVTEIMNLEFYTDIKEGGTPNDDLEMQLVWLKCLEEVGPSFTSRDLCEYWINHVYYNYDEYGFAKLNMKKGLVPPLTGSYNNWFQVSMGCPIRSEIWACVAPGAPDVAAALAFRDGVVDHTTESVWAEMFLAAVESAAFVTSDRDWLIEIGLSMIPTECKIAGVVRDTIRWHGEIGDWKAVRAKILDHYGHPNVCDVPQNMGFTILGWLAGSDFGDQICIAVNCGADTDCTGATLGSILGILHGRSKLPAKWTEPIGEKVLIGEGIINFKNQEDLAELTDTIMAQAPKVLAHFGRSVGISPVGSTEHAEHSAEHAEHATEHAELVEARGANQPHPSTELRMLDGTELGMLGPCGSTMNDLTDSRLVRPLWETRWDVAKYDRPGLEIEIDYKGLPTVSAGVPKAIAVRLVNVNAAAIEVRLDASGPAGWQVESGDEWIAVEPGEEVEWELGIEFAEAGQMGVSNTFTVFPKLRNRPMVDPVSFVLIGEMKWQVSGPYPNERGAGFDTAYEPEKGGKAGWRDLSYPELGMEIEPFFGGRPGILYMRHFVKSPDARPVHVVAYNTEGVKVFLNGDLIYNPEHREPIRPSFGGWPHGAPTVELKQGWNEFLLKIERRDKPIDHVHLAISSGDIWDAGLPDLIESYFPWDDPEA